ncbi:MAG: peroxiredoxin [Devosiaceae bacterium]|nr:peroxiredoxin [Devosiaceae bacterium]
MSNSNQIEPGQQIPDLNVWRVSAAPSAQVSVHDWLGQGKTVLFTLPGAYTPTCNSYHLPGYVDNVEEFSALGVTNIVCLSVNDHFVMQAWAQSQGALGKIEFIADFDAKMTEALGLERDLSAGGLGIRCKRSALIIQDGVVQAVFVDENSGQPINSSASSILDALRA